MLGWGFRRVDDETSFQYNYLNAEKKEIRLLILWPAFRHSAPIVCSIGHYALDAAPAYRALSYTWGDHFAEKQPIILNGSTFLVQPNLESALRHHRSRFIPYFVWADAVCIDQDDLEERNQQVMLMRDIYCKALIVNAWLGPASDESDRAMDFLTAAFTQLQKCGGEVTPKFLRWIASSISPSFQNSAWTPLAALMQRAWWSRVWVVQEVVLGDIVILSCGSRWMYFANFAHVCMALFQSIFQVIDVVEEDDEDFNRMLQILRGMMGGLDAGLFAFISPTSLFEAMSIYRTLEATDPRDKIYGLMGLVRDRDDKDLLMFQPRYDIPVDQLYKEFALHSIEAGKLEEILCACRGPHKTADLPSWTPDWSASPSSASISMLAIEPDNQFTASGPLAQSVELPAINNVLRVQGIVLGTIEKLSSVLMSVDDRKPDAMSPESLLLLVNSEDHNGENQLETIGSVLTEYEDDLAREYIAGGTLHDAWERTMFAINPAVSLDTIRHPPDDDAIVWSTTGTLNTAVPTKTPDWVLRASSTIGNRKFCVSGDGYMCLVPAETTAGDLICIFLGVNVPFIIRKYQGHHILIGDCFVNGYMEGEAVMKVEKSSLVITTIALA